MAIQKPKAPKSPAPVRPTAAPGVPVPQAYTGPSRSLRTMATQIGRDRALAEFYKSLVGEQREYDNDYRQSYFDNLRDTNRYNQEIAIQNNREWLKTGEDGRGIAAPVDYEHLGADNPSRVEQLASGSSTGFDPFKGSVQGAQPLGSGGKTALGQVADIMRIAQASDDPEATYSELMKQAASSAGVTKSKTQEDAEKKAARDEEESNWWGDVAGAVSSGFDKALDVGDAVTPDIVTDNVAKGAKAAWNSPVGEAAQDAGGFALRQLSRPSHAMASAADAYFGLNDDEIKQNLREGSSLFGKSDNLLSTVGNLVLDNANIFGASDTASLDDLDFEGIKKIGSAFKEGWSLENDTTFNDVIKHNAEKNPSFTVHDTLTYQVGGGIALDVTLDPLNLVGVGIITKPVKLAKEAKNLKRVSEFADEVAALNVPKSPKSILQANDDVTYTAGDVIEMLGGGRRYKSRAEGAAAAKRIQHNVVRISKDIERSGVEATSTTSKARAIQQAAERVSKQLEVEKGKFASQVVVDSAIDRAAKAEKLGDVPVGTAQKLAARIEQHRVVESLRATFKPGMAREAKAEAFLKAMGDEFNNHPALSDADRQALYYNMNGLTRKENPALAAEHGEAINRVKELTVSVAKAKSSGKSADEVGKLESALAHAKDRRTKLNKRWNKAQADVFMRSARARINQNLGTKGKRERELDLIAKQANEELERMGGAGNESPDFLNEGSYTGTVDDFVAEAKIDRAADEYPEIALDNPEAAFQPDLANFPNRSSQLRAIGDAVERERSALYPELVGVDELDTPLMGIPDFVDDGMGYIDLEKLNRAIVPVEGTDGLKFEVHPGVKGPDAREWLEDFVDAYNYEVAEQFSRLNNNAQRAANETARSSATSEVLIEDVQRLANAKNKYAKLFTDIFRDPKGRELDPTKGAKQFSYPSFESKGKRIFQNSKELAGMVDAPAISRTDKMKKFLEDPSLIKTEKDTEYVYNSLREFGYPVPNHPEAIYNYVTLNNRVLRDEFNYKNVAFAMRFKKAHGIGLEEAKEIRSYILGDTIRSKYKNSTWDRQYPIGMSRTRFMYDVTSSAGGADLMNVLDGAPFRITPKADEIGFTSPITRHMSSSEGGWKWLFDGNGKPGELNRALKDVGLPEGTPFRSVQAKWYDDMHVYLTGLDTKKLQGKLNGIWESSHKKQALERKRDITTATIVKRENEAVKTRPENINKARDIAFEKVVDRVEKGQQVRSAGGSVTLPHALDELDTAKTVMAAKKEEFLENVDEARGSLKEAKSVGDNAEVARLEKRLASLRSGWAREREAVKADLKKSREAKVEIQKRLREEAILSVANAEIIAQRRGLAFNAVGRQIPIPTTRAMFAAAEKAGGLPVIRNFFNTYKNMFASQAKLLPDEMLFIRNRAISDPSKIIGEHVRILKNSLGQVPLKVRQGTISDYANGMDTEVTQMIDGLMENVLPYFQNKVPVGPDVLTVRDINAYLPEKFRVGWNDEFNSPRQLLAKIMKDKNGVIDHKQDPLEAIWNTRIAIEQAMARKAMVHSLNETFGVKRGYKINKKTGHIVRDKKGNSRAVKNSELIDPHARDTVEKLKDEGWQTVAGMGHDYYFPPDTAKDIARLLEMFKPENTFPMSKLIDEATGIWKTSVTIYNIPGYYIRNGIGEVMSAWLAGVNSAKPYYKSAHVWRYVSQDTKRAEALAQARPDLGLKVPSTAELGKKHVVTLKNGKVIDVVGAHRLYREHGLSTGFINTEYRHHYNRFKEKLHSVPGVQKISNANEGLRQFNENYEDFYRMAHFIDKLGKAPKGMSEFQAAEWAAKSVRKYHFDYTDFTHAEKAVMLRVFPFYKWTRKALPLMSSMLFVKPGKMMAYPKAMEGMSEGLVSSDDLSPGEEHNGFMPNYYGIAPSNVTSLWEYQVSGEAGPDAKGDQLYAAMSTPQMDSLNFLSSPQDGLYSLLNPLLKVPYEQALGETRGNMRLPVANEDGIVNGEQVDNDNPGEADKGFINNRYGHLLRTVPPGQMLANFESGKFDEVDLARILSGSRLADVSEQYRNFLKSEGLE